MRARITAFLVRRRVTLGFVVAIAALMMARPTWTTWSVGLAIAVVGEALRIWAAGHLEKGREVTRSGPYRWTRHPLYVGSAIIALGVVIASRSAVVALIGAAYIGVTIPLAVRAEEAFLRRSRLARHMTCIAVTRRRRCCGVSASCMRAATVSIAPWPDSSAGSRSLLPGFCCRYNQLFAPVVRRRCGLAPGLTRAERACPP